MLGVHSNESVDVETEHSKKVLNSHVIRGKKKPSSNMRVPPIEKVLKRKWKIKSNE